MFLHRIILIVQGVFMDLVKLIFLTLYYVIDILILVYILYYFFTGIFAFWVKKKIFKYRPKNKFAVIIPARNEENVIGTLIESLKNQNYPSKLYDIFVVPNNCNDNTRDIALQCGAKIIDIDIQTKSKGDVLKYSFEYLNSNYNYDAYCIFDADNIVHPEFLRNMNNALCSGYNVAQGYRDTKNPKDSWVSSCYALFYYIQNFFFNQARMNMGWSSSINGTGFMVASKVIKENGFDTKTITEDIEFSALCALNNEKIAFVKEAVTYDEQPLNFFTSIKQRMRWSFGTIECLKLYFFTLVTNAFKNKVPQSFDMAIFFFAPIFQLISFAIILITVLFNISSLGQFELIDILCNNKVISLIIGYGVSIILSLIVVVIDKRKIKNVFKGIFTLSIFMITWIPINVACILKKEFYWEPIKHTRNLDIESVI